MSGTAQNPDRARFLMILVAIFLFLAADVGQAQTRDTLHTDRSLFVASDAALAAGFVVGTIAAAPIDRWLTRALQDEARQANRMLKVGSDVGRVWGFPGTFIAAGGIYLAGTAAGERRVQDLGLHAGGAVLLSTMITGGIKAIAGRARPHVDTANATDFELFRGLEGDDYQAFPSGHSTAAFAFASVVTAEASHWWPDGRWPVGVVTYGTATLTALSRIYNKQHWASDVIAGAAIGTITGLKVFRYQHSHPGNLIDNTLLRAGLQSNGGKWSVLVTRVAR
jgi:membrane-associated phospholipid phosphatase